MESSEKRFKCKVAGCKSSFSTSGHLTRHLKIHTGEKNHWCLVADCPAKFSRRDNMMQHFRSHQRKLLAAGQVITYRDRATLPPDTGRESAHTWHGSSYHTEPGDLAILSKNESTANSPESVGRQEDQLPVPKQYYDHTFYDAHILPPIHHFSTFDDRATKDHHSPMGIPLFRDLQERRPIFNSNRIPHLMYDYPSNSGQNSGEQYTPVEKEADTNNSNPWDITKSES